MLRVYYIRILNLPCLRFVSLRSPASQPADLAQYARVYLSTYILYFTQLNKTVMLVKLAFPSLGSEFPDVDMLRCKEMNNFATECVLPRRPKRTLPPLPEDKECSNKDLNKSNAMPRRKYRKQCLKLPALPEHDECWRNSKFNWGVGAVHFCNGFFHFYGKF